MWKIHVVFRYQVAGDKVKARWVHLQDQPREPTYDELNIIRAKHGGAKATRFSADGSVVDEIVMLSQHAYRVRYAEAQQHGV